jgi:fumarylacetoacetate (FAA) hydrolase
MRLATVRAGDGLRAVVWCRVGEGDYWVDIAESARHFLSESEYPSSLKSILKREGVGLATVRQIVAAVNDVGIPSGVGSWPVNGARMVSPIPAPGSFLDFYAFEEHVRRARARRGLDIVPEWYKYPVYYRSNQRAMFGSGAEIVFPAGETKMDFELELGAILGAAIESPTKQEAEKAIAGFCLLNDWSARAIQIETMKVGLGPNKGKDFATSLGPWMVTPDEIPDLGKVELAARVNDVEWSFGHIGAMRWSWGEMLAFAAEGVRFEAGDVFGSGTVGGGCGLEQDRFLSEGDTVELHGGDLFGVLSGIVRQEG